MLLYHSLGEHDGDLGAWSFHKGGNGGFTQVLARAAQLVRRRDPPRVAGRARSSRATAGPSASPSSDGTEFHAPVVVTALDPRRTFTRARRPARAARRPRRRHPALPLPGHHRQGQLRARRPAGLPGPRRPRGPLPRVHQHRPVDRLPRARLRRGQVRLVQQPAVPRLRAPGHRRPRHGAARQARHVVLRPVGAVPAARERLGAPSARTWATPSSGRSSRSSRASATSSFSARWSRRSTSSRWRACPRATSSHGELLAPQMFFVPPGARLCRLPHADRRATTSAARAPTRAAASPVRRACSRRGGSCATGSARSRGREARRRARLTWVRRALPPRRGARGSRGPAHVPSVDGPAVAGLMAEEFRSRYRDPVRHPRGPLARRPRQ